MPEEILLVCLCCPVAIVKHFLAHLNPKCQSLFQKPRSGSKFMPSETNVCYTSFPLGHNSLDNMMKNMCIRAGINPPYTNHSVRCTTVNILSSKDTKNRHIKVLLLFVEMC